MADARLAMEARLLGAALRRQRGGLGLAIAAIAIGASVASALLHVSGDVSRRLAGELRALGPNVLVLPPLADPGAPQAFLDAPRTAAMLARSGVWAAPVLYAVVRVNGDAVTLAGTDLVATRALHPQWRIGAGARGSLIGRRLADRLGIHPGDAVTVEAPDGSTTTLFAGAVVDAGGADDESWWLPIRSVQALAGLPDRASLFQTRIEGGAAAVTRWRARLGDARLRIVPIGSLTTAESELLRRMRRLMALVTICALLAAGLCALGTLTDRVYEQRRDFALLKALGGSRQLILRQFAAEAATIGLAGGTLGWLFGLGMAQVIGQQVFHTAIAVRPEVPPIVVGLALLTALTSSIGPARLALRVEPARALKGD